MTQKCGYKEIDIRNISLDLRKGRHSGRWLSIIQEINSKKIRVAEIMRGKLSALSVRSRVSNTIRSHKFPYIVRLRNNRVYVIRRENA